MLRYIIRVFRRNNRIVLFILNLSCRFFFWSIALVTLPRLSV